MARWDHWSWPIVIETSDHRLHNSLATYRKSWEKPNNPSHVGDCLLMFVRYVAIGTNDAVLASLSWVWKLYGCSSLLKIFEPELIKHQFTHEKIMKPPATMNLTSCKLFTQFLTELKTLACTHHLISDAYAREMKITNLSWTSHNAIESNMLKN